MRRPLRLLGRIGPGALVTAAFIGPGTVTVCTLAGARFGYALAWALLFATVATIVLQEMSGRLGTIAHKGLGEALRDRLAGSPWRWPLVALVLLAIYAGNAAYEAGNLAGAALGVDALIGVAPSVFRWIVLGTAALATLALWHGSYRAFERLLLGLVVLMGLAFIGAFIVAEPDWSGLRRGLLAPSAPAGSLLTIVALIGTTIVPYNLFLHAAAAKAKWSGPGDLPALRGDTIVSIGLGGLISIMIVSTAAASLFARGLAAESAADMVVQLEPLFGPFARVLLGTGLCAAGLTSALTAPMATAYAVTEIFGSAAAQPRLFRGVSLSVVVIGAAFAMSGIRPVTIIVAAQIANGLLLPIVATMLLVMLNDRQLLGRNTNGALANVLGAAVCLIALGLGLRSVLGAVGLV